MQNNENIYQVFIASSLRLKLHRNAAEEAIKEVNNMQEVKDLHVHFNVFRYENRPMELQKVEKRDAQEKCDAALRQSTIFFLIIDDVIRSLTQYEFEIALKHLDKGELPQEIHLFYDEDKNVESTAEGISYNDFKKKENLVFYVPNRQNEIVDHSRVYPIPFKAPNNRMDSLKEKMKQQLLAFVRSAERPFPRALRGYNLTKDHFFTDIRRKEKCPNPYLRRSFDEQLYKAITEGNRNLVIVSGASLSGKTRAVMEAMKTVNDGWIYLVNMEKAADELMQLSYYFEKKEHPKLYIVLDNFDQWKGDEEVAKAFENLHNKIWNSNNVIIATVSSEEIALPNDATAEWIGIKEMDDREFAEALDFFVASGAKFDERNLHYRRTGALFVDLDSIKNNYETWLNDKNDNNSDMKPVAKHALLKAFKALSIWRDDNIGNRELIESLTTWFCSDQMVINRWENRLVRVVCHDVLESLIKRKDMGVSCAKVGSPVFVQEYIYRYFLDYNGNLRYNDNTITLDNKKEIEKEKEKALVKEIIQFCINNPDGETLTTQLSRLCRRCSNENKKSIVSWLYGLWLGIESDDDLSESLKKDRELCEASDDKRTKHLYSNLIETYIYYGCESMEEARKAYNYCPQNMRTDHLFSALMRKAKPEEHQALKELEKDDYNKYVNYSYVIAVEVEWAENYYKAKDWIKRYTLYGKSPKEMADFLLNIENKEASDRLYDLIQLRRSLGVLALKVSNSEEFDDFCKVIKLLYLYLTDNNSIINHAKCGQYSQELTLIDLLAVIPKYALNRMLKEVFGGNLMASETFVNDMIDCVRETLDKKLTDELSLRLTISRAVSLLIRELSEEPYDDVLEGLFKPLEVDYKDKKLILRSIYTYTAMLSNNSCDMRCANSLLVDYLIPHTEDATNNPLSINTFALNMIMRKSRGKNKDFNIQMINRMFDQQGLQRDVHTYCILIASAKKCDQALHLLKNMENQKLEPNVYVLCELIKRPDVPLKTALTMMDIGNVQIPEYYKKCFKCEDGYDPYDIIDSLRERMSNSPIAWASLFKKKCCTKDDQEVLDACIEYLEEKKKKLLEDGSVYNSLISNESYKPFVNDVMNFVRNRKNELWPNSRTACHVIDRIIGLNNDNRNKAIERLNELLTIIMEGKGCRLDKDIVSYRLKLYRKYKDVLKMHFYDEQGNLITYDEQNKPIKECMGAFSYLNTMHHLGYSLTPYAVANYLSIEDRQKDDSYTKLLESFPELKTPAVLNKLLLWQFKAGKIEINDVLINMNWDNTYSSVCMFSDILNHYIGTKPKTHQLFVDVMNYYKEWISKPNRNPTSITFSVLAKATSCWDGEMLELLKEFDKQKEKNPRLILPPEVLSVTSQYTDTVEDLIKRASMMNQKGCPSSRKTADKCVFCLASHLLKSDHDAATKILYDLCQHFVKTGNAIEITEELKKELAEDAEEKLVKDGRNHLMLHLYKDRENVSASLLRTLIYYNAYEIDEEHQYSVDEMLACAKYYSCVVSLMEKLAEDAMDENSRLPLREGMDSSEAKQKAVKIAKVYIPPLFASIRNKKQPSLSAKLLSYLAYSLNYSDLDNYRNFVKQLYEMDCRELEGAVPGLAVFLNNYLVNNCGEKNNETEVAHKTLAQIIVYAKMNKLRNRHLLLEAPKEIPQEHAVWCFRIMNCEAIMGYNESEWEKMLELTKTDNFKNLIKFHVEWLDDAYFCSLWFCTKMNKPADEELLKIISNQEHRYTQSILSGNVYFKDVIKLPLKWYLIYKKKVFKLPLMTLEGKKWISTTDNIVMAIIRSISRMAWNSNISDTYNIDDYITDARNRCEEIIELTKRGNDQYQKASVQSREGNTKKQWFVNLPYTILGKIDQRNKSFYSIRLEAMMALMYDIALDQMAYLCSKGTFISDNDRIILRRNEKRCAVFIEKNGSDIAWLQQLPERWKKIKDQNSRMKNNVWHPVFAIVSAMLKNYVRIANANGEEACNALLYINRVKASMEFARKNKKSKVLIDYSMLGITENKECFILVPLPLLKDILSSQASRHKS